MTSFSMFPRALMAAALSLTAAATFANDPRSDAAAYPERPVRVIVSSSPGASVDTQARALVTKLGDLWGKPVLIDYVTGGNGSIAHRRAASATPDGYTLLGGGSSLTIAAAFDKDLGYDPETAFAGITIAVANSQMLVVRPGLGVKTFNDYIAHVKQKGDIPFAALSFGGIAHIINEIVAQHTGTKYLYVPYKGGGPANIALLGGQVDAMFITMGGPQLEHVRGGRMVALAVSTKERDRGIPDVPSLAELGLKNIDIASWQGYLAPSKTPKPLIDKINQGFITALRDAEVARYLQNQGFAVRGTTPAETDRQIKTEIAQFRKVIKAANIKLEDN